MADDPIDVRLDSAAREGLAGTAHTNVYEPTPDLEDVTVAPDHRPMDEQPKWRRDFAIDWPEDHFVSRRDFARFLVLTSAAFVAGQAWIAAKQLVRRRGAAPPRQKVGAISEIPIGGVMAFSYPGEHDRCLLVRLADRELVAFSQSCTHLSCAVVPKVAEGVFFCPCHDGYFDLRSGKNIAGPPPRPLPRILLEIEGDDVYATGVDERTVA